MEVGKWKEVVKGKMLRFLADGLTVYLIAEIFRMLFDRK